MTHTTAAPAAPPRRRSAIVALLLSLFGMGAGYLYLGRPKRALALIGWTLASIAVGFHGLGGWLASPLGFATYLMLAFAVLLAMVIDTIFLARRSHGFVPRWFNRVAIYVLPVIVWIGFSFLTQIPALGLQRTAKTFIVPSGSMEPNLVPGDRFVADMNAYRRGTPRLGDVAIVRHASGNVFIARIIGLPGERIALKDGIVHVDGRPVETRAAQAAPGGPQRTEERLGDGWRAMQHSHPGSRFRTTPGVLLAPGHYFLMGDNRDNSVDSRMSVDQGGLGPVPADALLGRGSFIYLSPDVARIGTRL